MPTAGGNAKARKGKEKDSKSQNKSKKGKKGNKAQKQESAPEPQASPPPSPQIEPQQPEESQETTKETQEPQEPQPLQEPQEIKELEDPKETEELDEPKHCLEHPEPQEDQEILDSPHPPSAPSIIESLPPLPDSVGSTPSVTPLSFSQEIISSPKASDLEFQDRALVDNWDNGNPEDKDNGDNGDKDNEDEDNEIDPGEPRVRSIPSPESAISSAGPATPAAALSNNPFDAPDNADGTIGDPSPPLRHPSPSAEEIPLPSPSPSEVKPRAGPAATYPYLHAPSPAPISSPHYSYGSPGVHPYAHAIIPPHNISHFDPNAAGNMAVTAPSYHTPLRSSTMDSPYNPYNHGKRISRASISRGYADAYYNNNYGPVREPAPVQPPVIENGKSASNGEGLNISLLSRIQSIIPDISQLVVSYRDQQTQLSAREAEHKQIETQHEESLMRKEYYIEALQAQMQKTANESAKECSKLKGRINELRFELGGLQEKQKDVEESLADSQKENDELSQIRGELQEEIDNLQRAIQEEKDAHDEELEKQRVKEKDALEKQKGELEGYFQEIKNEDDKLAAEQLKAREQELMDERDKLRAELEAENQELEEAKNAMATDYEAQLKSKQADIDSKQAEVDSKQELLEAKQAELDATQTTLAAKEEDLISKQGALDAKQEELVAKQGELKTTQEELETKKGELEQKVEELKAKLEELDAKQGDLDAKQDELEALQGKFETTQDELTAKKEELDVKQGELDSKQSELEAKLEALEEKKSELAAKNSKLEEKQSELDTIQGELTSKQAELESTQSELNTKLAELEAKQAELDQTKQSHIDELAALNETHEKERAAAAHEAEEKINGLLNEYQQKEEALNKAREDLEAQLALRVEELRQAEEEKATIAREEQAKQERLRNMVDDMRRTNEKLSNDLDRLKKTLHSLGEATDMKIKGDDFFFQCFGQLTRLIVDLSKEHFGYLPIDPPSDIIAKIPSEIPQFLDNTQASRELRSAYVQHVISKTLTYRIFQPFLFTLGRRYDKADTFFQMLSMDIRRKSVRREAYWRQQTLKAAYTTSDAKQAINVVAAVIVDEIIDHIRHFADPRQFDPLLVGVRKIVKLAAETWRLARVERELIISTMPSAEDEQTANEGWKEFEYDATPAPTAEDSNNNAHSTIRRRRVLLRMCPRIYREPVHEDFTEDGETGTQCVYLPGVVLYADSPSVLARKMEIAKKTADPSGSGSGTPAVRPAGDNVTAPSDLPLDHPAGGAANGEANNMADQAAGAAAVEVAA
ncbi:hypothetical protein ACJ72_00921 [Emergomyces africanus]|uniref:RNA polymerase Rpb1 C-terminal repeat domain-containing protein n=1 Tax=Emergomyces africanus TaxID=1955775 RepID=A0A1B7P6Q0_9EURO|nr:hypothetical protein ACJ72_00921 [Emergomyces africanus]